MSTATARRRASGWSSFWWRERWMGYACVTPMLLFLAGIVFFPLAYAFRMSLDETRGTHTSFVGLQNYAHALGDVVFRSALHVSIIFTASSVALHVVVGMAVALFLNQTRRGRTALRLAFMTPWMVAPVIGAITWVWLLNPQFGVVNYVLRSLGLIRANVAWLGQPGTALGSVIAVSAWRGFPFVMLILLAGLQSIPREQYEAAALDGASALQAFFYVTLPNLRYLLAVATTLDIIDVVRQFDLVAVMTGGGPVGATQVLPVLIYNTAFVANHIEAAAAIGVLLLLLLLVFSVVYIALLRPEGSQAA